MSSALERGGTTAERSAALGNALGDAPWLATLRAEAAATAGRLAMPDSRRERPWKYLDVSTLDLETYGPAPAVAAKPSAAELRARYGIGETASLLVQEDGETLSAESGEGVKVADFASVGGSAILQKRLAQAVAPGRSKLTALHYAYLKGGVLVEVAPSAEPKHDVRIVRNYTAGGQLATPHTLIVTGANSHVSVIEDLRSSEEDIAVIPAIEIFPGRDSVVRYTVLHRWGSQTRVFSEQHMVSEPGSEFVGLTLAVGGRVVKAHQTSSLEGRGSSSELYALCIGADSEHVDLYTLQDHIGPDTRSDLLFKSALKDSSRSVYYGLTRVGLGAKNADANQEDRNLLLSREARADSDPVLEILTNDIIRCSHGATAGPVDEEQLFYLQARGIPYVQAEALLVRGFLAQVLDRVPNEQLRLELEEALEAKLGAR